MVKIRTINNNELQEDYQNGKLDNLKKYIKETGKYTETYTTTGIKLSCLGRNFIIERQNRNNVYKLSFNFNTADPYLEDDKLIEELDTIVTELGSLGFDISGYDDWKLNRGNYNKMERKEKSEYKKLHGTPDMDMVALISIDDIATYDFETLLELLYPLFLKYSSRRSEEAFKSKCITKYNDLDNDLIIYDSEYQAAFNSQSEEDELKKLYCTHSKKLVKPDLVGLKKIGDTYYPVFIELKINISASIGKESNIVDHIHDSLNYNDLYKKSEYERKRFKESTLYILENKPFVSKNKTKEDIINNIDFTNPPELIIVCGIGTDNKDDTKEKLIEGMKIKFASDHDYENEIIIGEEDVNLLTSKGVKFNSIF